MEQHVSSGVLSVLVSNSVSYTATTTNGSATITAGTTIIGPLNQITAGDGSNAAVYTFRLDSSLITVTASAVGAIWNLKAIELQGTLTTGTATVSYVKYNEGQKLIINVRSNGTTTATNIASAVGSTNSIVLGPDSVWFTTITFIGYKSARVENTDTVYVQVNSNAGSIGIPITPSGSATWTAPNGKLVNAAQFYIDGTAGDGIIGLWMN